MSAVVETTVIGRSGRQPGGGGIALWALVAVFVVGAASFAYALTSDSMEPDFALLTVSFLYLMGVSQAGVVFSAIMRLVGAQWSKPYYRVGEVATLAFLPFAILVFLLIYSYAREDLFYWLEQSSDGHVSPWLDVNWLLIRNLFGLLLFYGLSAVYILKALRPDLPGGANQDHRAVERELRVMSPVVIVVFVICNTLFAWDFAMMLVEHWYSTVFPIFFSFGNVFAGTAALILFAAALGRSGGGESLFGPVQIRSLGMVTTGFTLIWLYLFWAQFFVIWFGNLPRETDPLWRQMYGHYAPYYWAMMAGCFFVPFIAFIFAVVKRSWFAMCILALGINAGIWLNKYLAVVPAFTPDDTPFDDWFDVGASIGLLAGFLAVMVGLLRRWPNYAYWEMAMRPGPGG
jgi:hypothetical protein